MNSRFAKKTVTSLLAGALLLGSSATLTLAATTPMVSINGVVQSYAQSPISVNGTTMVPMRDIFQTLGATIRWDAASQSVAATKSETSVLLTLDKATAEVNGKSVKLDAPAQSINGVTMVPLRFVSQVLGAQVKWNAETQTVEISAEGVTATGQTINGITVKYGTHTYGVDTQAEYTAAMKIVETGITNAKGVSSDSYVMQYLNGARWDGNKGNLDDVRNSELYLMEKTYGDLVNNGVPKETILKLIEARSVAANLVKGKKDLGDSKSAYSFYHTLVKGITDCDATAHTYSAVYDSYSFSTSVYYKPGHASPFIKVNGKVYDGLSLKYTGQPSSNLKALSTFQ